MTNDVYSIVTLSGRRDDTIPPTAQELVSDVCWAKGWWVGDSESVEPTLLEDVPPTGCRGSTPPVGRVRGRAVTKDVWWELYGLAKHTAWRLVEQSTTPYPLDILWGNFGRDRGWEPFGLDRRGWRLPCLRAVIYLENIVGEGLRGELK